MEFGGFIATRCLREVAVTLPLTRTGVLPQRHNKHPSERLLIAEQRVQEPHGSRTPSRSFLFVLDMRPREGKCQQ
jgi:hypothetical protein